MPSAGPMIRSLSTLGLSALLGVAAPAFAAAHPHVWVDASAKVLFDGNGAIVSIEHAWIFDEAFSASLVLGLDTNGDGIYAREELQELAGINVESLDYYHYFTSIAGAQETDRLGDLYSETFAAPRDYFLTHDGSRLTLHFDLPLDAPVVPAEHDLVVVDIYDPEYFVAFSLPGDVPVEMVDAPDGCAMTVDEPPELDVSYASILSLIPADGFVPQDLLEITASLANRARIICEASS